ncbi:MAG: redoxin domain-containing protein [Thermodesulfobacteriota bacterium]
MKRKIVLLFSIILGILFLVIPFLQFGRAASPSQKGSPSCDSFGIQRFPERKEAPVFSLNSLDGKTISLSEFRGKPVLITFWATWCDSCKDELPVLEKFSTEKGDQLVFLLITIDGERKKAAQKIIKERKVTLPVLLLLKEKVMDQYGVRGWVPQTFIIDREGKLIGKTIGERDWGSPEAWSCLKELLELR